jgi:hypothetical protein
MRNLIMVNEEKEALEEPSHIELIFGLPTHIIIVHLPGFALYADLQRHKF